MHQPTRSSTGRVTGKEPERIEQIRARLETLLEDTSGGTDSDPLVGFARRIAEATGVVCTVIGEAVGLHRETVRSLAVWSHGQQGENFEYSVANTPCERVVGRDICACPRGVRQEYPGAPVLVEQRAEAYLGVPLWDSAGQPLGLIALIHDRPVPDIEPMGRALEGVARRIGAELERRRAARAAQASEEMFLKAFHSSPVAMAVSRLSDGRFIDVNESWERMCGYTREELIGRSAHELGAWDDSKDRDAMMRALQDGGGSLRDAESQFHARSGEKRMGRYSVERMEICGEHCFLTTAQDITDQKNAERTLRERMEFDRLITSISTNFINLAPRDLDAEIQRALESVGTFAGVDRSYVFLFSEDRTRMSNTHEWCQKGITPAIERLQNLPADEAFPWFTERIKRLETVHVPRVTDLGPEAERERREWTAESIQSLVCVPFQCGAEISGFLGFDSVRQEKSWPDESIAFLRIVGEVFAYALARRRAEEALRAMFDQAAVGVAQVEVDTGRYVRVNRKYCDIVGLGRDEMTRTTFMDITHPDDLQADLDFSEKLRSGEVADYSMAKRFIRPDGSEVWVNLTVSPMWKRGDDPDYYIAVIEDITERKNAEEELRREHDRFQSYLDIVGAIIVAIDADQRVQTINRRGCEILGYDEREIVGKHWFDEFLPAIERDRIKPLFAQPVADNIEPAKYVENLILTRNGGERLIAWHNTSLRDEKGRVIGTLSSGEDITERRRAEKALRESEESFRELFENASDLVQSMTPDGHFQYVNPAWRRTMGYSEEEIANLTLRDVISSDHLDECMSIFKAVLAGKLATQLNIEFVAKNGDGISLEGNCNARVREGRPVAITGFFRDVTERKQAERRSEQSQKMLQLVLDNIPQRIFWKDRNGVYMGCNMNLARDAGLSGPEEVVGKTDYDLAWKKEQTEFYRECDRRVMNTNQAERHIIEPQLRADGTEAWLETNKVPLHGPDGKVIGVLGTYDDITERKRAEEALRESAARLALALDATNDGLWDWNLKTGAVYYSPRYFTMLGYQADELSASYSTWIDLLHPDDRDAVETRQNKLIEEGTDYLEAEFRLRAKDGSFRWILSRGRVVQRDEQNRPVRMVGTHVDLTERKRAERLAESARRFSNSLIETAPTFIVGIGLDGKTMFMNKAMCRATGRSSEDVVGKDYLSTFVPEEDRTPLQEVFERLSADEGPTYSENRILCADGRAVLVAWHGNAVYDDQGNVVGCYGIGEDISEKRQLEEQLRQAQKMESIGALTGGIAHDFNNLLTVILGNVSFAMTKLDKESDLHHSLSDVQKASERAGSLIRQMLAFSRKTILQVRPIDLQECVDETVALLRRGIDPRIAISVKSHPSLWTVRADHNQINQVIMNLCVNARDAMPGGGRLKFETRNAIVDAKYCQTHRSARKGEFVCLSVADNGTGMDDDVRARIFEPFFTTKKVGTGTGLGLAMAYGIITQHGGWIEVDSRPGKGTTFQVFLPRVSLARAAEPPPQDQPLPEGTETILVVDDESLVRDVARRILTGCGYRVIRARDGENAVRVFRKRHSEIDLVILDITMPKMTGYETLAKLREIDRDARVVFCTGQGGRACDLAEGAEDADLPLVRKPLRAEELATIVRKELDRRGPRSQ